MADLNVLYGTLSDGGGDQTFLNPTRGNDGNISTYTHTDAFVSPGGTQTGYLVSTLDTARPVSSMVIYGDSECGNSFPWVAYKSSDGTAWTAISATVGYTAVGGAPDIHTITFDATETAKYWRLRWQRTVAGFSCGMELNTWELTEGDLPDPEPGIWMDWNGDGFDATASTDSSGLLARIFPEAGPAGVSDNVTDRVLAIDWERGGAYDSVSPAGPGGATITLKNHDGRFDPDNASGPLFGKLKPGIPVWCGADRTTGSLTSATTVRGFFAGYVWEWVPTVDSSGERIVEVICEDAFGRYRRTPVTVAASLTRSQGVLRQAVLVAAGESLDRISMAGEPGMLPISAVDGEDALNVLEELNKATASRHYIAPADTKEDWYDYTLVNKYHKLGDAVDETWDGDDIQNVSGWRVTNANVIQQQRASVTPISLTPNNAVVWEAEGLPITVRHVRPYTVIAEFDDYVFGPTLDIGVTSGSVYSEIEGFGKTARIRIWTSVLAVVGSIRVLGQLVVRGDSEQVIAGDSTAGAFTGSPISSDYIGQTAAAQGVCDYIVWKFSTPLKRPKLVRKRKNATTMASILDRDLFDVVNVVIDELSVTARRLEIVGLKGSWKPGRDISMTYECQETPNQSAVDWFTVGTDTVGSSVPIAPF